MEAPAAHPVARTVPARRPGHDDFRRRNFHERVSTSMWWVPALFVVGSILLVRLAVWLDVGLGLDTAPDFLFGTDEAAAAAVAATLASGMLAFVGIVFTTTLVAIQLAGAQYSPRIVRVFVRSRLTHVTLGVFLATFVIAIGALAEIRSAADPFVPTITMTLVYVSLLVTLAMFITFVHGIVRLMRVQYLMQSVTRDGRAVMLDSFPPLAAYTEVALPPDDAGDVVRNGSPVGVIQAIDTESLTQLLAREGGWVSLLVGVGEYVAAGTPIAVVHGGAVGRIGPDDLVGSFLLGGERTLIQDPGFALRQLVDAAIRALSPAVNDPTTGVQAIDRIVDLLSAIAHRPDPTGWYVDAEGQVRVHRPEADFTRLARLGFVEIILYGAGSPQVTRRLIAALEILARQLDPARRAVMEELRGQLDQALEAAMAVAFRDVASVPDRLGFG